MRRWFPHITLFKSVNTVYFGCDQLFNVILTISYKFNLVKSDFTFFMTPSRILQSFEFLSLCIVGLYFSLNMSSVIFSHMMTPMMTTRRWPFLTTEYKPRDWREGFVLNTQHIPTHWGVESAFSFSVFSVLLALTCVLEVWDLFYSLWLK